MDFYKTLNECYEHSSNEICDAVKEIIEFTTYCDNDEQIELYAVLYCALADRRLDTIDSTEYSYTAYENAYIAKKLGISLQDEDKVLINNIMHLLHKENPSLRDEARQLVNNTLYVECEIARPSYEGIALTGKDEVPQDWQEEIIKAVADLDVVITDISMSWLNSHLDNGEKYCYDIPEDIEVIIKSGNRSELELAVYRVKQLHFIYKR